MFWLLLRAEHRHVACCGPAASLPRSASAAMLSRTSAGSPASSARVMIAHEVLQRCQPDRSSGVPLSGPLHALIENDSREMRILKRVLPEDCDVKMPLKKAKLAKARVAMKATEAVTEAKVHPCKDRRARRRQELHFEKATALELHGRSFLEEESVGQASQRTYELVLKRLASHLGHSRWARATTASLDKANVKLMSEMYMDGESHAAGSALIAAVGWKMPRFSMMNRHQLVHSCVALKGFQEARTHVLPPAVANCGSVRVGDGDGKPWRVPRFVGVPPGFQPLSTTWRASSSTVATSLAAHGSLARRSTWVDVEFAPFRGGCAVEGARVRQHQLSGRRQRRRQRHREVHVQRAEAEGPARRVHRGHEGFRYVRAGVQEGSWAASAHPLPSSSSGEACRGQLRPRIAAEVDRRRQKKGQVGIGLCSPKIREIWAHQRAVGESRAQDPRILREFCEAHQRCAVQVLATLVDLVSRGVRARMPRLALELFSGSGRWAKARRKSEFLTLTCDIKDNVHNDLGRRCTQKVVRMAIRMGLVVALRMGTPCASFSRARERPGGGPPPLRSREQPWGLMTLPPYGLEKIRLGNLIARFSIGSFQLCLCMGTPCTIENPYSSRIWDLPSLVETHRMNDVEFGYTDLCVDGEKWRKRTGILAASVPLDLMIRHCSSKGGCCD